MGPLFNQISNQVILVSPTRHRLLTSSLLLHQPKHMMASRLPLPPDMHTVTDRPRLLLSIHRQSDRLVLLRLQQDGNTMPSLAVRAEEPMQ